MKNNCIFPGTFDPVTKGHVNIVERALEMFEKVYVAVLINEEKTCYFTKQQRLEMLHAVFDSYERVEILSYDGMTVDIARELDAVSVRGWRDQTDYLYEKYIDSVNKSLDPEFETVMLEADKTMTQVSSTKVRLLIAKHQDVSKYVPAAAAEYIETMPYERRK